jgi:UDP-sulfoquinovose synthase
MKVLICGSDGYIGWPLAQYLFRKGHTIFGIDNLSRRANVAEMNSGSVIPIASVAERKRVFQEVYGNIDLETFDLGDFERLKELLKRWNPDTIIHLGEMPSAPYSMVDFKHASYTHSNNVLGNLAILFAIKEVCPATHLVKLGTMGEYGQPSVDIPEGFFDIEFRGKKANLMFPRQPGSWYHATKVHDTINIDFACRVWGLRSTDVMQGVVYGTQIEGMEQHPALKTRFDCDEVFGTAINRFVAQSIAKMPITLYGAGLQTKGFLPLRDSMQCLSLITENPPERGEYRVINQLEEVYELKELAEKVQKIAKEFGLDPEI